MYLGAAIETAIEHRAPEHQRKKPQITATENRIEQEKRRNGGQPASDQFTSPSFFRYFGFLPSSVSPFLLFNPVFGCSDSFGNFCTLVLWCSVFSLLPVLR
jgi:hypothetical protein